MRVLVSGGSRGLGLAISEHLLGSGHRVASFARTATDDTRRLATSAADRYHFVEADALDRDAMQALVGDVRARWDGLDVLVNNAASGQDSLLVHTSPDAIASLLRINLEAPILLTRLAVREMLRGGAGGRIVNIGSICARQGYPGLTVYAAAKGGLESFTRSLARECAGRIAVNTIAPGFFESEMSAVLRPEQKESIRRRTPSGRLTTIADVLPVLDMLLCDPCNIDGSVVSIDGGALA